jgi:hypothetical protein
MTSLNCQPLWHVEIIIIPLHPKITKTETHGDIPQGTKSVFAVEKHQPHIGAMSHPFSELLLILGRSLVDNYQFPIGIGLIAVTPQAALKVFKPSRSRYEETTDFRKMFMGNHPLIEHGTIKKALHNVQGLWRPMSVGLSP